MSATVSAEPVFDEPDLRDYIRKSRAVDNSTNLAFLAWEYSCFAAVIGGAISFCEYGGFHWAWDIPVLALAVVLIGGLQHRLAGLGHEASHYTLLGNKRLNDVVGDVFCMLPILSTVKLYRVFHLAHHRHTNDPQRDPDIVSLGRSKMVGEFPMSRWRFIRSFYLRPILDPVAFARYQIDYIGLNVVGGWVLPGLAAMLGWSYFAAYFAAQVALVRASRPDWCVWLGFAGMLLVLIAAVSLPTWAFARSPLRHPVSARIGGMMRLGFYTACLSALGTCGAATGGKAWLYFLVLWAVPLVTSFFFFMLLRDAYQHTNADAGRLTNTRVFIPDAFTRWAVFVYGQDMHVPHHLFPGIPHYRLARLHDFLKLRHAEYAANVVECHGTFANDNGMPTILDTLTEPRGSKSTSYRLSGKGRST